jgi:hypothetical protein
MHFFSTDTFDELMLYRIRQTSVHYQASAVEDALQVSNVTGSLLNDLPQRFRILPPSTILSERLRLHSYHVFILTYVLIGTYRIFLGTGETEDDEEHEGKGVTYLPLLGYRGETDGGHYCDYAPAFL